jgi:GTP-binding protein
LLTKADKLARGAARSAQIAVDREALALSGPDARVQVLAFSAEDKTGVEPAQALLDQWLEAPPRA